MTERGPILVGANEAAELLGVSRAHFYRMHAGGKVPAPVSLGRAVRWRVDELREWVAAGCPGRRQWEQIKTGRSK